MLLLLTLLTAAPAAAQDDVASDEGTPEAPTHPRGSRRAILREQLVLLLNPMGAEHRLDLGFRTELGDEDDLLTSGSHMEAGAVTAVSPVYAFGGGFVQLQPLSFLVLRTELVGGSIWPIGMDASGHYGVSGYGADVHGANLPADAGGTATGWIASFSATLQGAVELDDTFRLLVLTEWGVSRPVIGDAPFYYSMRSDLVLAREDVLLCSSSFLGAEARLGSDLVLRFGAYDDFRHVPASGYVGHQLGPIAMLEWAHVTTEIGSLAVFVRGGGYTHHAIREGEATILGGIAIDWELGGL